MRRTIEIEYASIVDVCGHGRQPHKNELDARFSLPDRRHSFYSGVYPGVLRRSMVRAWPPHKNELDARFSFPDRRHSIYSGVYPGVCVPSRLDFLSTITPFSQKCIEECSFLLSVEHH